MGMVGRCRSGIWAQNSEAVKKYSVGKNGSLKYKGAEVANVKDITFATERDASLVDFIDSTKAKVLSRHKAGFAVHVQLQTKQIQDMHILLVDLVS